ncbi:MAG: TfoX/Sxy family protein [Burkholderiaceae bacterium]|nr:TfoX/Sxy family protein [Burkholderiaceae bacterium]
MTKTPSPKPSPAAAASRDFATYCCELLGTVGPCSARRMFGGWGISTDGLTIAIIADLGDGERLWLKADAQTAALFETAGCQRFVYRAKGKPMSLSYYSAPEDAMDGPGAMHPWALPALESALKARKLSVKRDLSASLSEAKGDKASGSRATPPASAAKARQLARKATPSNASSRKKSADG